MKSREKCEKGMSKAGVRSGQKVENEDDDGEEEETIETVNLFSLFSYLSLFSLLLLLQRQHGFFRPKRYDTVKHMLTTISEWQPHFP